MMWCEHCRDHFVDDHYLDGDHLIGAHYGPVGRARAKEEKYEQIRDAANAVAAVWIGSTVREADLAPTLDKLVAVLKRTAQA